MEDIKSLLKKIDFLKFSLSNTVDPINVIHIEGQIKELKDKIKEMNNKLKGGVGDKKTLDQIAEKHKCDVEVLKNELSKGIKVELEHTNDEKIAKEIALDHLWEDLKYYQKLKKIEAKEMTGADSSGSFEAPAIGGVVKRQINTIPNMTEKKGEFKEATDASSSGAFDVPLFGSTPKGRKDPLKIEGPKSIAKSRAVKDKNFPKWGGPNSVFVKVKEKCKKFPYCNQGDINAIEPLREAIEEVSKKYGLPISEVENIVLNEIKQIFI